MRAGSRQPHRSDFCFLSTSPPCLAKGAFFIIQINRRDGDVFTAPPATTIIGEGDGDVLIGAQPRSDSHFTVQAAGPWC